MKKWLILNIFCLLTLNLIAQTSLPQLQAGVPLNDSIDFLEYYFYGSCYPAHDVDIFIDTNLIPVVTGVELKYIVTQFTTPPGSIYSSQAGILHLYDTLSFSHSNSFYRFYSPLQGTMQLKLMLTGTPTVPFETYPCELIKLITLSNCTNSAGLLGQQFQCSVGDFNSVQENKINSICSVDPNPASHKVNLNLCTEFKEKKTFILFNLDGKEISRNLITTQNSQIDVSNIPDGFYVWELITNNVSSETGKLIINRN